jgi:hypothetical protein
VRYSTLKYGTGHRLSDEVPPRIASVSVVVSIGHGIVDLFHTLSWLYMSTKERAVGTLPTMYRLSICIIGGITLTRQHRHVWLLDTCTQTIIQIVSMLAVLQSCPRLYLPMNTRVQQAWITCWWLHGDIYGACTCFLLQTSRRAIVSRHDIDWSLGHALHQLAFGKHPLP